ncbi:chitinase [Paenibacillus sp. Marseille-Q4541]|uniref:chitinase n=1 Tax=Paenibacillus sp. Marseille-Q4541 TaxID=2831522 RepID=UPI001BAB7A63|nr:chitinase [Paenibacillus sp. Marseille-Q4541]
MTEAKRSVSRSLAYKSVGIALSSALLLSPFTAAAQSQNSVVSKESTTNPSPGGLTKLRGLSLIQYKGSFLDLGEHRLLSRKDIVQEWDDIDPDYSPDKSIEAVKALLSEQDFEQLFPYRLGSDEWFKVAKGKEYYKENQSDYFSYDNLIQAVQEVSNLKIKISTRSGTPSQEIVRLDKEAKVETLVLRSDDFNSEENKMKTIETVIVDCGTFLKEGFKKDRKRELAAFLANLSHETGGGWADAPGGELKWGLFWNENIAGRTGVNMDAFVDPATAKLFPGVNGQRYYGRGPIMLSWNFNYGLFSSIIYGDKNVLLKNPEQVAADGKLGYMTAILFWMTPQDPKPSAHDVMVGRWKPNSAEKAKGLVPGFGASILVLNGLEADLGETIGSPVLRRAGHYRDITKRMGVDITGEKIDTLNMKPF